MHHAPRFVIAFLLLAPSIAQAQPSRCDCAASSCQPMEPQPAVVRGRITEGQGNDANDRVEHFLAIEPLMPVCAEVADPEHADRRHATSSPRLQLVVLDAAIRDRLRTLVGRTVTVRGVLSAQITAHHHTPLLLDARAVEVEPPATHAAETEGDASRVAIDGRWRVTETLRSAVSAMTAAQVRRVMGQRITLGAPLHTPWEDCATPTYRHASAQAEAFMTDAHLATPGASATRRIGLTGTLTEWRAVCTGGAELMRFYDTPTGHILVGHDGVWFVLSRVTGR
jgi:Domain of unknown function (DUF4431)